MVAKSNAMRKEPRLILKKDTVRDLDVKGKAASVKGGQKKKIPSGGAPIPTGG
jgi:hypothetical protein